MINPKLAAQLRKLIEEFADAQEADSWKGTNDPGDRIQIEHAFAEVKRELYTFIGEITAPTDTVAIPTSKRQAQAMLVVAQAYLKEGEPTETQALQ